MTERFSNLDQGFDLWSDKLTTKEDNRNNFERKGKATTALVIDWLSRLRPSYVPFLFVHWIDPHGPYSAPADAARRFVDGPPLQRLTPRNIPRFQHIDNATKLGHYIDAYDTEIAYVDEQLGKVFEWLRANDLYDRSLIIFAADHGEGLGEQEVYFRHGVHLHDPEMHIPLLIKPPGDKPASITQWAGAVSLVDVLPTVADYLGIEITDKIDGISLKPVIEGKRMSPNGRTDRMSRIVFSARRTRDVRYMAAHTKAGSLMAEDCLEDKSELLNGCRLSYVSVGGDLNDPKRVTSGRRFERLRAALEKHAKRVAAHKDTCRRSRKPTPAKKLSQKDRDALKALGYLE